VKNSIKSVSPPRSMTEIPASFTDAPYEPYDDRVQALVVEVMRLRSGVAPAPEETIRYFRATTGHNVRGKHLVVTPTAVFSAKTTLDTRSNGFTRCDINIELPRNRSDLTFEVVVSKKSGKQFLMFRLGNMKMPGILAEEDDLFDPEELGQRVAGYVAAGHTRRIALADELPVLWDDEIQPASMYILIRRFEARLRRFVLGRLQEVYEDQWLDQVVRILGDDLGRIKNRIESNARRYGGQLPDAIEPEELMEHLGFEHYRDLMDSTKIWTRCFRPYFLSREEVIAGLIRISHARNEVAHGRPTAHPQLWQACQLDIDSIQGQMTIRHGEMDDIVRLVQLGSKALVPA
jgi:hypothetical protein